MGFLNVKLAGFFKYVGFLNTITLTPESLVTHEAIR